MQRPFSGECNSGKQRVLEDRRGIIRLPFFRTSQQLSAPGANNMSSNHKNDNPHLGTRICPMEINADIIWFFISD
jgi:hypothetical protein